MTLTAWEAVPWKELVAIAQSELGRRTRGVGQQRQGREAKTWQDDDEAWKELARRIRLIAEAVVVRRFRLEESAEDIVQEVLLRMQGAAWLERLASMDSPGAYLAVVVRHAALSVLRRQESRRAAGERFGRDEAFRANDLTIGPSQELLQLLERELNNLPLAEQDLLRLRFWQQLSTGQIAARLRISYSAAAVRVFRLLRKLSVRLASQR